MTEFNKTSEVISQEAAYVAVVGNITYDFKTRIVNDVQETVSCTIKKNNLYIGSMYVQSGQKQISLPDTESASIYIAVLEEFLQTLQAPEVDEEE